MDDINELLNISNSILKLYRHIIDLSDNNQDTTVFWEIVSRLSKCETELLEKIVADCQKIVALDEILNTDNNSSAYDLLLTNDYEHDDVLVSYRIRTKMSAMILRASDDVLLRLYDVSIPIVKICGEPNVIVPSFYNYLLYNAYIRNATNLECLCIQSQLEKTDSSEKIDFQRVKQYQTMLKYIFPFLENAVCNDSVSNLFHDNGISDIQKNIFNRTLYAKIGNQISTVATLILNSERASEIYDIDSNTFSFLCSTILYSNLAILNDEDYIQIRDDLNGQLLRLLSSGATIKNCFIDLIQKRFAERDKKINKQKILKEKSIV